jgi:hypothetical protein
VGLLLSASCYAIFWHSKVGLNHPSTAWISQFYNFKQSVAKGEEQKKLLIVAGSTGLFSFDSKQLAEVIETPVINLSVAAGLGLKYILDKAKLSLNAGDSVLLPLEYNLYQDKVSPDQTLPLHLLDNIKYFDSLPVVEQIELMISTPLKPLLQKVQSNNRSLQSTLYQKESLTPQGDIDSRIIQSLYIEFDVQKFNFKSIKPVDINTRTSQIIKEFVEWAKNHDVYVIAMPPAIIKSPLLANELSASLKGKIYKFWDTLGIPFLGEFEYFEFEKSLMFENPYHVNHKGRKAFMDNLIPLFSLFNQKGPL